MSTNSTASLHPVRRFFHLLELDRKDVGYIYLYALFAGVLTLSLPLGVQAVIGLVQGGAVSSSLIILIAAVSVGTLMTGWLRIMQISVAETLQRRIFSRSAFEFALRLPRLQLDQLHGAYAPELTNRFFDTLTVQKSLPKTLMDFSTSLLQIVFGLVLISFYHPFFVFFGLMVLLVLALILRATGPKGLVTSLEESKYKYMVAHWLQEVARAIPTFKLASGSHLALRKANDFVNHYLDARGRHFKILIGQYRMIVWFKTVVTAVLLALGGILVIDNQISIGQFVAAEIVVLLILNSVEKVILTLEVVYDLLTAIEKIGQITDLPLEHEGELDFAAVDTGQGMAIDIHDLSFQHPDGDQPVLRGVNLSIKPGEKICIAGYSGAGKSTLLGIVAGLRTKYDGTVSYNGIPFHNLSLTSLRSYIGDHGNQEDIFRGTLWENICLGHEDVDFQRIVWAVEQVGLSEYVKKLPLGYETELLPGGLNLSRSVRTKIILARSIVSQPRLLALEEFLNNMQVTEQERLADMLTARNQDWTLIAVSNDPAIAARCERVILMDQGRIIAEGTYEELKKLQDFQRIFQLNIPSGGDMRPIWPNRLDNPKKD